MTAADETTRESELDAAEDELAKAIGALPLPWGTSDIEPHLSRITRAKDRLRTAAIASAPQGEAGSNLVEVAPQWAILFEDQSRTPVFYHGTEADARAVLAHYETQWACHLYVAASSLITHPAPPRETRTEGEKVSEDARDAARYRALRQHLGLERDDDWNEIRVTAHVSDMLADDGEGSPVVSHATHPFFTKAQVEDINAGHACVSGLLEDPELIDRVADYLAPRPLSTPDAALSALTPEAT